MEVVPLTLLRLDARDFIKLTRGRRDESGKAIPIPHKWTFYFFHARELDYLNQEFVKLLE
jgi:nitric oxide reductase subunit B